ncbi:unnamed protein product, partial [Rhizoctonia solani]
MIWEVLGDSSDQVYSPQDEPQVEVRDEPSKSENLNTEAIDRHMSTWDMFDRLVNHGCVDLSLQMDTKQDSAVIASGGGFGDIWMGKLYNGTKVAIKAWRSSMIEQCDYKKLKRATREIYYWSKMKHENIHQLMGVIIFKDNYLGMVSQWMENGNLSQYIRANPDVDRYQLCIQVASGLAYMHACNMVHGDLKSFNVLISSDGIAKLSDFGLSTMYEASIAFSETSITVGTTRWAAPELLDEESPKASKSSDVYALGMTMLEIFTGAVPYPQCQRDFSVMRMVQQKILPTRPEGRIHTGQRGNKIWELLMSCWNYEPNERPSAQEVVKL